VNKAIEMKMKTKLKKRRSVVKDDDGTCDAVT
jgi:hypothetical protein